MKHKATKLTYEEKQKIYKSARWRKVRQLVIEMRGRLYERCLAIGKVTTGTTVQRN